MIRRLVRRYHSLDSQWRRLWKRYLKERERAGPVPLDPKKNPFVVKAGAEECRKEMDRILMRLAVEGFGAGDEEREMAGKTLLHALKEEEDFWSGRREFIKEAISLLPLKGIYWERFRKGVSSLLVFTDRPSATVTAVRFVEIPPLSLPLYSGEKAFAPAHFPELQSGSILLKITSPGFKETLYPILLKEGEEREIHVNMAEEGEIPDDFIYIHGGDFPLGGDERAAGSAERFVKTLPSFAISRFPVTLGDYVKFLDFLGPREGRERAPRDWRKGGYFLEPDRKGRFALPCRSPFGILTGRLPAFGISWFDATAYAEYISSKRRMAFGLPSEWEWERGARGADLRPFPWGRSFHPSLCKMRDSREGDPLPEPVGSFSTDESPYGIRDMAGGVREWCLEWFDREKGLRALRGGGFDYHEAGCRSAHRSGLPPERAYPGLGFRLCIKL